VLRQMRGSKGLPKPSRAVDPRWSARYRHLAPTQASAFVIIEAIGEMVKAGQLSPCEFINVESEFAAMSVIDRRVRGRREGAYTATASQGCWFMMGAVYNARAGLGLPIVMTLANRAIGAPINYLERSQRRDGRSRRRLDSALRRGPTRRPRTCTFSRSAWPRNSRYGHGSA